MEFNIYKILYLFLRLSPFMIVSYFVLLSVFNQDMKGIVLLAGLIFTVILTLMLNKLFPTVESPLNAECQITSLGKAGAALSLIPLGVLTLAYVFSYIAYIIIKYSMINDGIPVLIIFPILVIIETVFQIKFGCTNMSKIFIAIVLGGLCGFLWSSMIDNTGYFDLQYFNGISSKQVCNRPTRSAYRCRISKKAN